MKNVKITKLTKCLDMFSYLNGIEEIVMEDRKNKKVYVRASIKSYAKY